MNPGTDDIGKLKEQFEIALRAGQVYNVAKALNELNIKSVPRHWRLPLANICRRAGLVSLGLRLLEPVLRVNGAFHRGVTPGEMAEYAVLLQRSGVVGEALRILSRLDVKSAPEALLYKAYCYFNVWDYHASIAPLEAYMQTGISGYTLAVGQVNLAGAYLTVGDSARAKDLIDQLTAACKANGYTRLLANCHEMKAQWHFHENRLSEAKVCLNDALDILKKAQTLDQLFASKWYAAIAARESGSTLPLRVFREEASRRDDPESVREADLLALQIEFGREAFDHLYFGTPFEAYRARARMLLGHSPRSAVYLLGEEGMPEFDLVSGEIAGHGTIPPGSKIHQLFDVLFRDFYRPYSVGSLFSELFPGEHFDIEHAPDRIHQLLRRARIFLKAANVPLVIRSEAGKFRAVIDGRLSVRIPLERELPSQNQILIRKLNSLFSEKIFTANEARQALDLSAAGFKRLASWAVEAGEIEKLGAGTATKYILAGKRRAA